VIPNNFNKLTSPINHQRQTTTALKGLAIIAVLLIHLLTVLPRAWYFRFPVNFALISLNQLTRFSVPFFITLSGLGLSLKYQKRQFKLVKFIRSRVKRLLPLYLLWTLFFIGLSFYQAYQFNTVHGHSWWQILFLGKANYHLYFVPLILQLYAFFAVIKLIWQKIPSWLTVGTILLQLGLYLYFSLHPAAPGDQSQYSLLFSWLGYFSLGVWLGERQHFVRKKSAMLLAGLGAILSIVYAHWRISATHEVVQANRFTKVPVVIYAWGCLGYLLHSDEVSRVSQVSQTKTSLAQVWQQMKSQSWLQWLGRHSYLLYIAHTIPLHMINVTVPWSVFLVVASSYLAVIWLSSWLQAKIK
jgi:peptidoglycan/LPS O-acetylase OafA/YrhL